MRAIQTYDFIIVGAGSAGCVLANRLSDDPSTNVLLLETGGSDRSLFIQMPTALSIPMNTDKFAWQFHTEPEPYLDNRVMHCPRGKVLGGSSSINGMVYVRGHADDFNEWRDEGATGWSYADCLPYFKRADNWIGGASDYRADNGPLNVNLGNNLKNPLYSAFIEAGGQAGYPKTQDYNGYQQEGFGPMQMTIKNGYRWSTANAYLKPILHRRNLTVKTGVVVSRVRIEQNRATGVEYIKNGKTTTAHSRSDVIISAGSISSPHLLQLSGIGDPKVLESADVSVLHDLPGVGQNLQDHLEFYFQYRCKQPITLNGKLDWFSKGLIGAKWLLTKSGLGATNHFESCGFIRSKAGVKWPDIQYHFLPAAMRYDGRSAFDGHGFQLHVGHNKPKSRGSVTLRDNQPTSAPRIQFNYLQHPDDIQGFRDAVRLSREIIAQPAMDPYRDNELQPGLDVQSDEEIDAFIRRSVESAYHPSCSCKMGAENDVTAVVDNQTRVRGIEGLRVVDSSIFPTIPNGNLNSPTIMVAEKAADLIMGNTPLKPLDVPVFQDPDWLQEQRSGLPLREV